MKISFPVSLHIIYFWIYLMSLESFIVFLETQAQKPIVAFCAILHAAALVAFLFLLQMYKSS